MSTEHAPVMENVFVSMVGKVIGAKPKLAPMIATTMEFAQIRSVSVTRDMLEIYARPNCVNQNAQMVVYAATGSVFVPRNGGAKLVRLKFAMDLVKGKIPALDMVIVREMGDVIVT
jgi:hypothetical protein